MLALQQPDAPSMYSLWRGHTHQLNRPRTAPLLQAGARLAQQLDAGIGAGQGNPYHNLTHFKEVLICAGALLQASVAQGHSFSYIEQTQLLFSAMVHDFAHDGGRNGNQPQRLEKQSVAAIKPVLDACGVAAIDQQAIALMIGSTDVSKSPDYLNGLLAGKAVSPPPGYENLAPLGQPARAATAELAAMLRDADILFAAGVTGVTAALSKERLSQELNQREDASHHNDFLKFIVSQPQPDGTRQVGFASQAGKFFNPNIPIVAQALWQLRPPLPQSTTLTL